MRQLVIDTLIRNKVIAIARGLKPDQCLSLAEALHSGGITMMELTFDQSDRNAWSDTCCGIAAIEAHFGDQMLVGAGTVLTLEQLRLAREAGARYIISPDANADIIRATRESGLVSIPGCMTPTEIAAATHAGADFVKLFPAGSLGVDYIRAVRAPLSHVQLLAVGGVDERNARDFLAAGCVGVGVGGKLVNKAWIKDGEYDKITGIARAYVAAVNVG